MSNRSDSTERFASAALTKLPEFNPDWLPEIRDAWWRSYFAVARLGLNDYERAPPEIDGDWAE